MQQLIQNGILIFVLMLVLGCQDDDAAKLVLEYGTVADVDENEYVTVKIGNLWWMAENLRVTKFKDGEPIRRIEGDANWATADEAAYCEYDNESNDNGLLYNFHVVTRNAVAPDGWRVATDDDWKNLEKEIGMVASEIQAVGWRGVQGDRLKKIGAEEWTRFDPVWGTDEVGFSATAGSCRFFRGPFGVPGLRGAGYWWVNTSWEDEGWYRYLDYKKSGVFRYTANKNYGFSIRCVKDVE